MSKHDEESKPSLIANWLVKKPDRYILPKMKLPIFIKELKRQGRLEVLNELQKEIEIIRSSYPLKFKLAEERAWEEACDKIQEKIIEKLKAEK